MSTLFHVVVAWSFGRVWLWHFSEPASHLPGAEGFGWFFRYLTFCSYTIQTALFASSACLGLALHLSRRGALPTRFRRGREALDALACAAFPLANTVSLMFYSIQYATGALVEGTKNGATRPPWLDFAVHGANSLAAWGDLLVAPDRSFSRASARLAALLTLAYALWLVLVRERFGRYPYPVLNAMPAYLGFPGFFGAGAAVMASTHAMGKGVRTLRRKALDAATEALRERRGKKLGGHAVWGGVRARWAKRADKDAFGGGKDD